MCFQGNLQIPRRLTDATVFAPYFSLVLALLFMFSWSGVTQAEEDFVRLPYNNPGLTVDLGVGLWAQPLPMDYDGDGDHDLLVATSDKPSNGLYFFENTEGDVRYPVFKPGVRISSATSNVTCSYIDGEPHVLAPNRYYPRFKEVGLQRGRTIPFKPDFYMGRTKQWKYCDYDGDGRLDIIVGVSDWQDYGWDNAFNEKGEWTRGPLHGYVYVALNTRSNEKPRYEKAFRVEADGKILDVYGCPSPNFVDFDKDGDLDLVCGEFLDKIHYFENVGTRTKPRYAAGRLLMHQGEPIKMDLEMLQVVAFDWDKDGDTDLLVGQEDGRVALVENTGAFEAGTPAFLPPKFFQQQADYLKVGALCTPFAVDWDQDGDQDIVAGDTAGYINFVENLDGGNPPRWAAPLYLKANGEVIRIQAGPNGSIQGPAEAKWGYTVLNVADWDHDGLLDVIINSIWGKICWYKNVGTATKPVLAAQQPIEVAWEGTTPKPAWFWWNPQGNALVTQWRTSPMVYDLNKDGLNDLIMLDQEGYLAWFERKKTDNTFVLLPPKRIFKDANGDALRLNVKTAGGSGRRKLCLTDWDGDGKLDFLINSKNIEFWRNVGDADQPFRFENQGLMGKRILAGHTTCPTIVDWDKDGIPDLLAGAEDGFFYYLKNTRSQAK